MKWKHLFYAALAAMLPIIYGFIFDKLPDFPLAVEQFCALVMWAVGLAIGGWQVTKFYYINRYRLKIFAKDGFLNIKTGSSIDWRPILKAMLSILIPILYESIIGWDKSFPISEANFGALFIWAFGLMIGGWQISKSVYIGQSRLLGD